MSIVQHFIFNVIQSTDKGCKEVAYAVQGVDVDTAMRNFYELQQGEVIFEGPEVDAVLVGVSLDAPPKDDDEDSTV